MPGSSPQGRTLRMGCTSSSCSQPSTWPAFRAPSSDEVMQAFERCSLGWHTLMFEATTEWMPSSEEDARLQTSAARSTPDSIASHCELSPWASAARHAYHAINSGDLGQDGDYALAASPYSADTTWTYFPRLNNQGRQSGSARKRVRFDQLLERYTAEIRADPHGFDLRGIELPAKSDRRGDQHVNDKFVTMLRDIVFEELVARGSQNWGRADAHLPHVA
eukprot:TRINITY_DN44279_c0_g1_i2.p1 TRINITY_DN44279_c0_g1~~TRINITY_DN44279_c0_g1_i2.p1  ORF type:complete len:220 (+),score=25.40 TRINITY_DN44279_c0_g1_i2:106-765(+)